MFIIKIESPKAFRLMDIQLSSDMTAVDCSNVKPHYWQYQC